LIASAAEKIRIILEKLSDVFLHNVARYCKDIPIGVFELLPDNRIVAACEEPLGDTVNFLVPQSN
jgi:hypothetical protein